MDKIILQDQTNTVYEKKKEKMFYNLPQPGSASSPAPTNEYFVIRNEGGERIECVS